MRRRTAEVGGFTLIELLVVVALMGILTAIALPQFAGQQGKAFDAAVESDARLAATAQEAYFAGGLTYTSNCDTLPGYRPSRGVFFAQCSGNSSSFLVETDHPNANQTCTFDSSTQPSLSCAPK